MSLVSSLWINLCSTDKVFCRFYARGRLRWLNWAPRCRSGLPDLEHLTEVRCEPGRMYRDPSLVLLRKQALGLDACDWLACLELRRVKSFASSFPRSKGNFRLIATCKCQNCTLKLFLPVLGSAECSATHHVSTSQDTTWGSKAVLQTVCATLLLAKCFHSSRGDVQKKENPAVIHLLIITSQKRCEIFNLCTCTHDTALMWQLGGDCCLL